MITSSQNSKIKRVRLLNDQAKTRRKQSAYVLEGIRLLEEALASEQDLELVLYTPNLDSRGTALVNAFKEKRVITEQVSNEVFKDASDTETPQGILGIASRQTLPFPKDLDFLVIIDAIRDPGNLGTLMRTCLAAGVDGLLLSPGTVDPFSPKVLRSGMGAHFRLPIEETSWPEIIKRTSGLQVFLAEMGQGVSLWEADFTQPLAILVGGEAHGPGKQARDLNQQSVHIPMSGMESLNAAIAGAVLLYEVRRQRSIPAMARSS